eukprot:scaffold16939_cov71-Phaeocystis_antarctica.AAC.4
MAVAVAARAAAVEAVRAVRVVRAAVLAGAVTSATADMNLKFKVRQEGGALSHKGTHDRAQSCPSGRRTLGLSTPLRIGCRNDQHVPCVVGDDGGGGGCGGKSGGCGGGGGGRGGCGGGGGGGDGGGSGGREGGGGESDTQQLAQSQPASFSSLQRSMPWRAPHVEAPHPTSQGGCCGGGGGESGGGGGAAPQLTATSATAASPV